MEDVTLEAYDVLQINRGNGWQDFSTLRDAHDFHHARRIVLTGMWEGKSYKFRVVRFAHMTKQTVLMETK